MMLKGALRSSLSFHLVVLLMMLVRWNPVMAKKAAVEIGRCPKPATVKDFDISQYMGRWYEYERFSKWFESPTLTCVYAQYTEMEEGRAIARRRKRVIQVENAGIDSRDGEAESIRGQAFAPDPKRPAQLKVRFSPLDLSRRPNYFVLATDYVEYAVVYSCFSLPLLPFSVQSAWILTRSRGVAPGNLADLKASLADDGIDPDNFFQVNQDSCEN